MLLSSQVPVSLLSFFTTAVQRTRPSNSLSSYILAFVCKAPKADDKAERIRNTTALFWDEAIMLHRLGFEAVDKLTRAHRSNLPLGGEIFIFGGFRLVSPMVLKGSPTQIKASRPPVSKTQNFGKKIASPKIKEPHLINMAQTHTLRLIPTTLLLLLTVVLVLRRPAVIKARAHASIVEKTVVTNQSAQ